MRKVDIACRYAGDEFVLILPEAEPAEAEIVAKNTEEGVGLCLSEK